MPPRPLKCPHCGHGFTYDQVGFASPIPGCIPSHGDERWACPGTGQAPRNALSDRRPLWKDERHD